MENLTEAFANQLEELNVPAVLITYLKEQGLTSAAKCHYAMNSNGAINKKINDLLFIEDDENNMERGNRFRALLASAIEPQPIASHETKQDAPLGKLPNHPEFHRN